MVPDFNNLVNGSSLLLPVHGRAGARATSFLAALFAKQKTKFGGDGKKLESESEGGQKLVPCHDTGFLFVLLRKVEDSNLRSRFRDTAFQVRRIRPLCQPSNTKRYVQCSSPKTIKILTQRKTKIQPETQKKQGARRRSSVHLMRYLVRQK